MLFDMLVFVLRTFEHYFLYIDFSFLISADYNASPADNDTQLDMVSVDKTHTLKEKGKMRPYDIRGKII